MRRREFIAGLGSTAAWPLPARAQQPTLPVIGVLHSGTAESGNTAVAVFRDGLRDTGVVEGRDVAILYRWADGHRDRLAELAADLVRRQVAVIAAIGDRAALAAKTATTQIPIVATFESDPVRTGLVDALTHPGHNVTGVYRFGSELETKRLEILCELVPRASVIDMLVNPDATGAVTAARDVEAAARRRERRIRLHAAKEVGGIDEVFADLSQSQSAALLITADPLFDERSQQLGELSRRAAIPAIHPSRAFAAAGGLMSYAADASDVMRVAGRYAGRILKGAADLPVQQTTRILLTVNLKSAKSLGITLPPALLAGAAEVIE